MNEDTLSICVMLLGIILLGFAAYLDKLTLVNGAFALMLGAIFLAVRATEIYYELEYDGEDEESNEED